MNKVILILCILCFSVVTNAQDIVYVFPINPDTKEWEKLKTEKERLEVLQVPEDILKNISTINLIKTCINYPAFGHFTAFNNTQEGIKKTINNFNGLQELYKREDAPKLLFEFYQKMDSVTLNITDNQIDKRYWSIRRCFFEYLLIHEDILNKMNKTFRMKLLKEARKKFNHKIDNRMEFSTFSIEPTLLTMAKILDKEKYSDFEQEKYKNKNIDIFLETGKIANPKTLSSILTLSDNFIQTENR